MARKYNLEAEMVRKKVDRTDLCKLLDISYNGLLKKITGQNEFKCEEMFKIQAALKTKKTLDVLFSDDIMED